MSQKTTKEKEFRQYWSKQRFLITENVKENYWILPSYLFRFLKKNTIILKCDWPYKYMALTIESATERVYVFNTILRESWFIFTTAPLGNLLF